MRRGRLAVFGLAVGVISSQAGHLVAYQLRFGAAAEQIQSTGAHSYFPMLVKTGLGLGAAFVLLSLVGIGFARVIAGRRLEAAGAPSLLRLVAMLFCVQLACFFAQETAEMAAGAPATSAASLLLWGTAGQLPVAVVGAIALRWLAIRLGHAVAHLLEPAPAIRLTPYAVTLETWPVTVEIPLSDRRLSHAITRRGPPF